MIDVYHQSCDMHEIMHRLAAYTVSDFFNSAQINTHVDTVHDTFLSVSPADGGQHAGKGSPEALHTYMHSRYSRTACTATQSLPHTHT